MIVRYIVRYGFHVFGDEHLFTSSLDVQKAMGVPRSLLGKTIFLLEMAMIGFQVILGLGVKRGVVINVYIINYILFYMILYSYTGYIISFI